MIKLFDYAPALARPARPQRKRRLLRRLLAAAEMAAVGLMFLLMGVWVLVLSFAESHRLGAALMEAVSR